MDREQLSQKLHSKINAKRITRNAHLIKTTLDLDTNEGLIIAVKSMIMDTELPYIKRIKNIVERSKVLEKKYKPLKDKYQPIYTSIVSGDFKMENIGMLEMMLVKKDSVRNNIISFEDADERMKEFLYEKYKIDDKPTDDTPDN